MSELTFEQMLEDSIKTIPAADFIQLFCIGAVLPSYYDHHVSLTCKSPGRPLTLLCRATYSIHNTTIVTFFFKNFNYIIKFIVVKCRLRDNANFFPDSAMVIICAHGVSKRIYEILEEKGLEYVDATCPFVKRIHGIVEKESGEGKYIVIVQS